MFLSGIYGVYGVPLFHDQNPVLTEMCFCAQGTARAYPALVKARAPLTLSKAGF